MLEASTVGGAVAAGICTVRRLRQEAEAKATAELAQLRPELYAYAELGRARWRDAAQLEGALGRFAAGTAGLRPLPPRTPPEPAKTDKTGDDKAGADKPKAGKNSSGGKRADRAPETPGPATTPKPARTAT